MRWGLVSIGIWLLFIASYFDNIRGPLLPVFGTEFSLTYSQTSLLLIVGNLAAVIANLALIPILGRYGDHLTTLMAVIFSTLTGAVAGQIFSFPVLVLFAGAVGVSTTTLSAVCNLWVIRGCDEDRRAAGLNLLHMTYGIASFLAPKILTGLLSHQWHWPISFYLILLPLVSLLGFLLVRTEREEQIGRKNHWIMPRGRQWLLVATMNLYVAGEVMISMWMSSYLTKEVQMPLSESANYLSGFFLAMLSMRFACFLWLKPQWESRVMVGSLILSILFFIVGFSGQIWAFPLAGILGPFYPLFFAQLSRDYPETVASLMFLIFATNQIVLGIAHLAMGRLADVYGIGSAYGMAAILLAIALILVFPAFSFPRRHKLLHS